MRKSLNVDQVGLWEIVLIVLIAVGRNSPLRVTSVPRQEILGCLRVEKVNKVWWSFLLSQYLGGRGRQTAVNVRDSLAHTGSSRPVYLKTPKKRKQGEKGLRSYAHVYSFSSWSLNGELLTVGVADCSISSQQWT